MAVVLDDELLVLQTQHLERCTAIVERTPLGVFPGFFPPRIGSGQGYATGRSDVSINKL